jgi:hypothetical protein
MMGCTTTSYVSGDHTSTLQGNQADSPCVVQVFTDKAKAGQYVEIKKIETHINRNVFFGGSPSLERDAYPELKDQACALGGNGVIIDDQMRSLATEQGVLHVWATVIRSGS